MKIRTANKTDFDSVFTQKEFAYLSWEYLEDSANALQAKHISLHIDHQGEHYILPLIEKKFLGPFRVAFSIPFGLYGGIIHPATVDAKKYLLVLNAACNHLKMGIIFQNIFHEELLASSAFTKIKKVFSHLTITIDQQYEAYAKSNFSHGMKEGVKKAIKNNVQIVVGNDVKQIEQFYSLYETSNSRWGKKKPRYSLEFFKHFTGKDYFQIRLAYFQGKPAGGLVMLKFRNYYFDWFAGMDKELRNSRANDYLHADVIRESIENNFSMINFGASANLPGVQKFKESFGAKEMPYHIYFCGNPIAKAVLLIIMKVFY